MRAVLWFFLCLSCFFQNSALTEGVYTLPPLNFTPKKTVAVCSCEQKGKVLFLLRNKESLYGNTWCLPGDKILGRESPAEAVIRAVSQETGVYLHKSQLSLVKKFYVRFPNEDFELYLFRADVISMPNITLNGEKSILFKWLTPQEALTMPLILGMDVYIDFLMAKGQL